MSGNRIPNERLAQVRILDANANRAEEGLRVIEEFLRFVVEDPFLAGSYKQFRHELTSALASIPFAERASARETQGDVGTHLAAADEYSRASARDVATASQKRLEQALRCLEEYSKPLFPHVSAVLEKLRYRAYTLGRAVELTAISRERLSGAKLYVLLDGSASLGEFESLSQAVLAAGAHVLQLRDKVLPDGELLVRARRLRAWTRAAGALFVMNDRPDLAQLCDADGVHVGQDELSVKDVRALVGPHKLIGVSTHSLEQARQAVLGGANYIGCGPVFPSATKQFTEFAGRELLRQVAAEIGVPAFAIGGITLDNLPEVLACGAQRVAVSAAITRASQPAEAVRQFLSLLVRER